MMGRYDYGFPEYVSVAQKRANAAQKLNALKKKNPEIQPVVIEGRSLSRTWWGKSWNENLERYADYSNRIGRGRSYVRLGAVLDLRIEPGKIHALVQGSQASPYQVAISIQALNKNNWNRVKKTAEGQLDTLAELLAGKFPKPLQEVFFAREEGLFPGPKEIDFDCSCPDWASMCKHVAAALYGVGARLDANPSLFFKLRKIKMDDLITQAVKSTSRALLKKAKTRSSRVLDDANLTDVFGIKLDKDTDLQPSVAKGRDKGIRSRNRKQRTAVKSSKKTTARQDASKKVRTKKRCPENPLQNWTRRPLLAQNHPRSLRQTGQSLLNLRQAASLILWFQQSRNVGRRCASPTFAPEWI